MGYILHSPAARKAGKVRGGYRDWLTLYRASQNEGSVGMAKGRNGYWVDSSACYALDYILIHQITSLSLTLSCQLFGVTPTLIHLCTSGSLHSFVAPTLLNKNMSK